MADRELQSVLSSGEIATIKVGGTGTEKEVQLKEDIDALDNRLTTAETNITNNTNNISTVDVKANQTQRTGVKSGFVATITRQPANNGDTAEITLGASGGVGQIATRSPSTGEITLSTINLTSPVVFDIPRGSFFLLYKEFDGTTLPSAVGSVNIPTVNPTVTIQWVANEPDPTILSNHIQFAKVFGASTPPNLGLDVRLSSATNPIDLERRFIEGNQVSPATLSLNTSDNTKLDMSEYWAFRQGSSGVRDQNIFYVPSTIDIASGGSDGTPTGKSNPIKGHLYNLKIKDNDLASWSYSGTTITLNTTTAHSFEVGQLILVEGLVSTTNTPNSANYPDNPNIPAGRQNTKWTVSAVPNNTTIEFIADDTPTGTPTFDGSGGQISKNNIGAIEIVDLQPGGTYGQWWNYYDNTDVLFPSTRHLPQALAGNQAISHKLAVFPNYNENNAVLVWGQSAGLKTGNEAFDDALANPYIPLRENSRLGWPGGTISLGRIVTNGSVANLSTAELFATNPFEQKTI